MSKFIVSFLQVLLYILIFAIFGLKEGLYVFLICIAFSVLSVLLMIYSNAIYTKKQTTTIIYKALKDLKKG